MSVSLGGTLASVRGLESKLDLTDDGGEDLERYHEAQISRQHTEDSQKLSESAVAHLTDRHNPIGTDERRRLLEAELQKLGQSDDGKFTPDLDALCAFAAKSGFSEERISTELGSRLRDVEDPVEALLTLLTATNHIIVQPDIHYMEWALVCSNRESEGANYKEHTPELQVRELQARLVKIGLQIRGHTTHAGDQWIIQISASAEALLFWATRLGFRKRLKAEPGINEDHDGFGGIAAFDYRKKDEFFQNKYPHFHGSLFHSGERQQLVRLMMENPDDGIDLEDSVRVGVLGWQHGKLVRSAKKSASQPGQAAFENPLTEMETEIPFEQESQGDHTETQQRSGRIFDCIQEFTPLHDEYELDDLICNWASWSVLSEHFVTAFHPNRGDRKFDPNHMLTQPVEEVRDYFGEKVALYFAFISTYTRALLWLATLGIMNYLVAVLDIDPLLQLQVSAGYSVCVVCWTIIFMETLGLKQSELSFLWGTELFEETEKPRKAFAHSKAVVWRTDPWTGKLAPFRKNKWNRVLKVMLTNIVVGLCLVASVGICVLSHMMKEMDGRFGDWCDFVGSVFNVLAIMAAGSVFNWISDALTEWENHRTQTDHEDSRIYKTFVFDAVNNYFTLFFTLFLKNGTVVGGYTLQCMEVDVPCPVDGSLSGDIPGCGPDGSGLMRETSCMSELQLELLLYFMIGQFFQTVYTTYLGTIQVFNIAEEAGQAVLHRHHSGGGMTYAEHAATVANRQHKQGSYTGVFMDYSELAVQFGYTALFASCFPVAPLMCCIGNILELRADAYKLCRRYRRPEYLSAEDIGAWENVLKWLATAAILTNATLLVIAWQRIESEAAGGEGEEDLNADGGAVGAYEGANDEASTLSDYRLWIIVVVIEHMLFLFRYISAATRPEEPEWISQTKAHMATRVRERMRTDAEIARDKNEMENFRKRQMGWSAGWVARKVKAQAASNAGTGLDPAVRSQLVKLFYTIDVNASGTLSPDELQAINEAGVLHDDCMSYDTDDNGLVSVVEWLEGWQNRAHTEDEIRTFVQAAHTVIDQTNGGVTSTTSSQKKSA